MLLGGSARMIQTRSLIQERGSRAFRLLGVFDPWNADRFRVVFRP
jgi:hypothetical protein